MLNLKSNFLTRHALALTIAFTFAWLAHGPVITAQADAASWSLASPDGRCQISVSLSKAGELTYQVKHRRRTVLPDSPLGLRRDDQAFEQGLVLVQAGKVERRRETYELFTGNRTQVDTQLNQRSLIFQNANRANLILDLAASNEGVAFRYRFAETTGEVRVVQSELTGFAVPRIAKGWLQPYHAAGDYTPAYEDYYYAVSPGDAPPQIRAKPLGWGFPALFQLESAKTWLLITESGTDASYCATHLTSGVADGLYRIAFPAADEATKRQANKFGPEPRYTLPWVMPWRVIVLGDTAADIAMSTLVTDLAAPSQIADTSWIKPGRSSWSWWAYPEGPNTAKIYNQFTDLAARMKWEYTLFDGGWWEAGLKPIAEHARTNGIASVAWSFAGDFYDPARRKRKLDELAREGANGVKIDFWCSDRQEAIAAMHSLFADAAARRLVVNLHGCTLPRGWQRTWPNFLTAEAVVGTESYFYEATFPERAAELNTLLPFARNAVGPMDYTPVALTFKKYPRQTTAAHELATAIVFTSGIVCYSDKPEVLEALPPAAVKILQDAPARWDESRCLVAEPGRAAVFARRAGDSWFIAGLNSMKKPMLLELNLREFRGFDHATFITEGSAALMQVDTQTFKRPNKWKHELPAQGGFILRLNKP